MATHSKRTPAPDLGDRVDRASRVLLVLLLLATLGNCLVRAFPA